MKATLKIEGRFYNALRAVAPKNDVRHYLNGVLIDFEKHRFVATDGHRLLIIPMNMEECKWDEGKDFPPENLIVQTTHRKVEETLVLEVHSGKEIKVFGINYKHYPSERWQEVLAIVDGSFPDVDRVIPSWPTQEETVPLTAYNPFYLADVCKELHLKIPCMRVVPCDATKHSASHVEFMGIPREDLIYVLMGMRW